MTDTDSSPAGADRPAGAIDARGPRVSAGFTSLLLLVGIAFALIGNSTGGSLASLTLAKTQPLSALFRAVIQPRLSAPTEWEDPRPPRFAQGVGLVVVGAGLVLHLIGVPWALVIAGAAAFVAAALNASIGFCLGCEIYLLLARAGITGRGGERAA
jgi:hypothetical protein